MGVVVSFFSDENVISQKDASSSASSTFKKPKYYKGKDGPSFVLLDYNKIYETRRYKRLFFISTITDLRSRTFQEIAKENSKKLKEYLNGMNSKSIRMNQTCPLICKVSQYGNELASVTFSLVLPEVYNENPPAPTTNEIFLEEQPARIFYAITLKGSIEEKTWTRTAATAAESLKYNSESFEEDYYYIAVYDDSFRDKMCHNEVLFAGERSDQEFVCLLDDDDLD